MVKFLSHNTPVVYVDGLCTKFNFDFPLNISILTWPQICMKTYIKCFNVNQTRWFYTGFYRNCVVSWTCIGRDKTRLINTLSIKKIKGGRGNDVHTYYEAKKHFFESTKNNTPYLSPFVRISLFRRGTESHVIYIENILIKKSPAPSPLPSALVLLNQFFPAVFIVCEFITPSCRTLRNRFCQTYRFFLRCLFLQPL